MSIYFAHVGRIGSKDFEKTLRKPVSLRTIESALGPGGNHIIEDLRREFSDRPIFCWGIPSGGKTAIKNLGYGDFVFMVEHLEASGIDDGYTGPIPMVLKVRYHNASSLSEDMYKLSKVLWGDSNFPAVFFVDVSEIDLDWRQFCSVVGYRNRFNPMGKMLKVTYKKIEVAGGEVAVLKSLLQKDYKRVMDELAVPYSE